MKMSAFSAATKIYEAGRVLGAIVNDDMPPWDGLPEEVRTVFIKTCEMLSTNQPTELVLEYLGNELKRAGWDPGRYSQADKTIVYACNPASVGMKTLWTAGYLVVKAIDEL